MLSRLMDRFPVILWIGAAILGRVGGHMMITDPLAQDLLVPPTWAVYAVEALFVVFVCGLAKLRIHQRETGRLVRGAEPEAAV
jgi:predicted tellurium resistance membrane protein TerC